MGGWFLSFAIANYAGGLIATLTGGHGGGEVAAGGLVLTWSSRPLA